MTNNESNLMMQGSKSHSKGPMETYANTQYYMQHGSELLNRSLKQQVRVQSSSMASRKQRQILMESRKRSKQAHQVMTMNDASSKTKDLPDIGQARISIPTTSHFRQRQANNANSGEASQSTFKSVSRVKSGSRQNVHINYGTHGQTPDEAGSMQI